MTGTLTGTRVLRTEDPHLLRGETTFVANLDLPDVLTVHYVTSINAHALIRSVDTTEARTMPGVVDIVTAADIADAITGPLHGKNPAIPEASARGLLATDRVRFVGEAVVAIVAETEALAIDAAELVSIVYEPLPAVIGIEAALESETHLFPEVGSNVMLIGQGANDEPPDFSDCEVVVETRTVNQRVAPCPIGLRFGRTAARRGFRVLTSSSPYGQGHYTSWAMLVAERTGVPLERIEVVHGDTDVVPKGGVTGGSRSTQRAGSAVAEATDTLVVTATDLAAELLEAAANDVVLDVDRGVFHVTGAPGAASVGWTELAAGWAARAADNGSDNDKDKGKDKDTDKDKQTLACESEFDGDGPSVPYGMHAAAVTVDLETGQVTLNRVVTVDDAGTMLNPMLVEGQLHGGIAQGIGQALFEEFVYDDDGNPLTGSFLDYGIPSAAELPGFEVHMLEIPSSNNPLGFKGVAESGCIGITPAIQNAVIDAVGHLGVRHIDMPLTPSGSGRPYRVRQDRNDFSRRTDR